MLKIAELTHSYDDRNVLNNISLAVTEGEIICLLGPSGCGKTTLLRTIAGLEKPKTGRIFLYDKDITDLPVHERQFGLMFQDYALFPHMNVAENIQFGLRMTKIERQERERRLQDVLRLVNLVGYEKRDVSQLSGGEKQRVALARSLVPKPSIIMLDEPLGSLDATLRKRLVLDLKQIIKEVGLTAIYVTHDQQEAFTVADRIAVMNAGNIEQIDEPRKLYQCPESKFVAEFLGLGNVVPVNYYEDGNAVTPIGIFPIDKVSDNVFIHPRSISVGCDNLMDVCLEGTVLNYLFSGEYIEVHLDCGKDVTLKFITMSESRCSRGDRMLISFNLDSMKAI